MKSQNDWIFSSVAVVLALIVLGIAWGTKREPVKPPAPTPVVTTPPQYPTGDVVYTNSLPSGNNSGPGGTGSPGPGIQSGPGAAPGGRTRPSLSSSGG